MLELKLPVTIFLLTTLLIGLHASRRIDGKVRNFYVGGNIIPFWVLALSLTGQAIETGSSMANAKTAMTDFWSAVLPTLGIGASLLLIGLFYAEPLNRMKLLTLPDFYGRRFDRRVEGLTSVLCLASFIILIASNLAGIGMLLDYMFGLPPALGAAGIAALVVIYTVAGGLFAVSWNDVLHVSVILGGFIAAFSWMVVQFPVDELREVADGRLNPAPLFELDNFADLLALALGDVIALDFMERVFAAKTPKAARRAALISGAVTIAVGSLIGAVGILASKLSPGTNFLTFVGTMPHGIAMMVMLGLVAACISTIDGALMACANVIMRNLVQRWFPTAVPRDQLLPLSRFSLVPVAILAVVLAIAMPEPTELLILAFDVVFAGCFVPLTLGLFGRRGTKRAALWAIVVPSFLRLAAFVFRDLTGGYWLEAWDTLVPPAISLLIFVGLSVRERRGEDGEPDPGVSHG